MANSANPDEMACYEEMVCHVIFWIYAVCTERYKIYHRSLDKRGCWGEGEWRGEGGDVIVLGVKW